MAFIETKIIRGRPYYYLVKMGRVNGQPRKVKTVYLGTGETLLARLNERAAPTEALRLKSYPFGKAAALLRTATELNFVETVDHYCRKRSSGGLTVGQHLLLAILARAHEPWSKAATGRWFDRECFLKFRWSPSHPVNAYNLLGNLRRLAEVPVQRRIEEAFTRTLVQRGLRPSTLFWDVTNHSNFGEEGENLPRPGHAKDHRYDLNLVSTGLVVTEDHVPLLHETLPGNCDEYDVFSQAVDALTVRLTRLEMEPSEMILVMDRGANSTENLAKAVDLMHVVGCVPSQMVPDLFELDLEHFTPLHVTESDHPLLGYLCRRELYEREWNVAVTYNTATAARKEAAYRKYEARFVERIQKLKAGYERTKGRPLGYSTATAEAAELVHDPYRTVFRYTISENPRQLTWEVNEEAKARLHRRFGKRVFFSDLDLDAAAMARTYEGRYRVEQDFRWMKGDEMMPFAPLFVRKDDSIRAHAFLVVMGLLLWRLTFAKVREAKIGESEGEVLEALEELRLTLVADQKRGKVRSGRWVVEQHDELAEHLYQKLGLDAEIPA